MKLIFMVILKVEYKNEIIIEPDMTYSKEAGI